MSTTTYTELGANLTTGPDSTIASVTSACPYCGAYHEGTCPRVEELEYYPNGTLKRVRLRQEPTQVQICEDTDTSGTSDNIIFTSAHVHA